MRVAILGTRGIPNHYGGFEQCAEYLASGLVRKGFDVIVYNSHNHPYKESNWNGVKLVHCYDPEDQLGTAGQFIYDLNCILDLRRRKCDVVLQLGYTSSSIWGRFMPSKTIVTTNMDGLEWKRTKFSGAVRKFLLYAEKLAIKHSDYLISDSIGIQEYIKETYQKESTFIPYGADLFDDENPAILAEFGVQEYQYDMLIARLEPENSIEIILDGVESSQRARPFLVIGKHMTHYGEYLKNKYINVPNINFIGGVYDINKLNNLRYYSNLYFHGHTVGGTNPSLLEAMASNSLICANDNPFNKYILGEDAFYFSTASDVSKALTTQLDSSKNLLKSIVNNRKKIHEIYAWDIIVTQYADHLVSISKT